MSSLRFFVSTITPQHVAAYIILCTHVLLLVQVEALSSLRSLDVLRQNASSGSSISDRNGMNIDVVGDIGLCNIGVFIPYSKPGKSGGGGPSLIPNFPRVSEGQMAAAFLAMDMLNNGDGSVVKEIQGMNKRCPIRFTGDTYDTRFSSSVAVDALLETITADDGVGGGDNSGGSRDTRPPPKATLCSILGPVRSAAAIPMGVISGVKSIPHMAYVAKTAQLDDKSQFSTFARLSTSDEGDAYMYVVYLKELGIRHLGVIHWNDAFGTSYSIALLQIAQQIYPELQFTVVDIPSDSPTNQAIEDAISILKQSGYRWFLGILAGSRDYVPIMTEAVKQGIAGTGHHVWLHTGTLGQFAIPNLIVPKDSPVAIASHGVGMLSLKGGFPGRPSANGVFDKFVERMKSLGESPGDLEYLQSKMPTYPDVPDYIPTPMDSNVFGRIVDFLAFPFDEIIMLGLAACNAHTVNYTATSTSGGGSVSLTGGDMYKALLDIKFQGATGNCTVDAITGTRIPSSAYYQLNNFLQEEYNETHVTFTSQASKLLVNGKWVEDNEDDDTRFVYNDNTTNLPSDLPPYSVDMNYIGSTLRRVGLSMAGAVLSLSLGFAAWTVKYRNEYVLKASQPTFLLVLCCGTFVMGASMIGLLIDDEIATIRGCTIACMSVPWLFSTGFVLVFSTLYAKTLRIHRLFTQTTSGAASINVRAKVTLFDVIRPLVALLTANLVVLASWTAVAPLEFVRTTTRVDIYNRPIESQVSCVPENESRYLPFVIALAVLDIGALLLASYQCYLTRHITQEFAESEHIFKAIGTMLLVSFFAIPLTVLVNDDTRAEHFVLSSLIFVLGSSVLVFIFVPKISAVRRQVGPREFRRLNNRKLRSIHHDDDSRASLNESDGQDTNTSSGAGLMFFDANEQLKQADLEIDRLRTENGAYEQRVAELERLLPPTNEEKTTDEDGGTDSLSHSSRNNPNNIPDSDSRRNDGEGSMRSSNSKPKSSSTSTSSHSSVAAGAAAAVAPDHSEIPGESSVRQVLEQSLDLVRQSASVIDNSVAGGNEGASASVDESQQSIARTLDAVREAVGYTRSWIQSNQDRVPPGRTNNGQQQYESNLPPAPPGTQGIGGSVGCHAAPPTLVPPTFGQILNRFASPNTNTLRIIEEALAIVESETDAISAASFSSGGGDGRRTITARGGGISGPSVSSVSSSSASSRLEISLMETLDALENLRRQPSTGNSPQSATTRVPRVPATASIPFVVEGSNLRSELSSLMTSTIVEQQEQEQQSEQPDDEEAQQQEEKDSNDEGR